ncbi:MAG: hypothetical protein KME13_21575 [Myxacorys californica WJT36-NPBG1]|jgi:hypothetical protein|nr:hypothetical protein [Myxacorys californica WJT36-NPBG1]
MTEPIDTATTSVLHTPAYASFDFNTDKLKHFIQFMGRGFQGISQEATLSKTRSFYSAPNDLLELNAEELSSRAKKINLTLDQLTEIDQEISDYAEKWNAHISGFNVGVEWMPVLIVTIVEAYLMDVLVYAASTDSIFMEKSGMSSPYSEMANASSLEELLQGLRSQWARKFINDGGPKYWIHTLTKMGARGYSSELTEEMETLWGIRHLIVHSTGIATPDFVHRHPDFGVAVGERIQVKWNQLGGWCKSVYHFVDVTDAYFAQRCKLKSSETQS